MAILQGSLANEAAVSFVRLNLMAKLHQLVHDLLRRNDRLGLTVATARQKSLGPWPGDVHPQTSNTLPTDRPTERSEYSGSYKKNPHGLSETHIDLAERLC